MSNFLCPAYLTEDDLRDSGFSALGQNVKIARQCVLPDPKTVRIGSHVRIDAFTIITGVVSIGSYVHIGPGCSLIGSDGITFADFSTISHGVKIFTRSDDFSGEYMTNPSVPPQYTGVTSGSVFLGKHVVVGAGSVILPGVSLAEGAAVGALSLVKHDLEAWYIYAGTPCRQIKIRAKRALELEAQFKGTSRP